MGLGANIGALAGKAAWYAKGQNAALKAALEATGKKILPTPTAIIDVTTVAVVVIDLMNGFGAPDSGSGFSSGVDELKIVDGNLELAIPDSRDWSGSAADEVKGAEEAARSAASLPSPRACRRSKQHGPPAPCRRLPRWRACLRTALSSVGSGSSTSPSLKGDPVAPVKGPNDLRRPALPID